MPLFGRTVLVMGGAGGLGKAIALECAARRAQVAITSRSLPRAQEVAKSIIHEVKALTPEPETPEIIALECDVTRLPETQAAVQATISHFGRITDVVATVGTGGRFGRFDHLDPAEWRQVVDVNLFGTYHTFLAALDPIRSFGGGTFIAMSGYGAIRPAPYISPYSSSKAAVVQLVRSLAKEFENEPIRFLVFSPGLLEEGITQGVALVPQDAKYYNDPYERALRGYLRKPLKEAADLVASLIDPAYLIPSGEKVSLHKPFEVAWAQVRARIKSRLSSEEE